MIRSPLTLLATLRDPAACAEIPPDRLTAYASAKGWQHERDVGPWRLWRHPSAPEEQLMLPDSPRYIDYGQRVQDAIQLFAEHERRSQLAVWADLSGLADPTAAALEHLDAVLASMVEQPAVWAQSSEALLFQALLALRIRAMLRGEPDPDDAYQAAKRRRRIPSALHACDRLDLAGVAALVAEVAGLPSPGMPSTEAQATLPGMTASPQRKGTHHVYGRFELRAFKVGPLFDAEVQDKVRSCRACSCQHRITSAGPRQGKVDLYSSDGGATWAAHNPTCIRKRRG